MTHEKLLRRYRCEVRCRLRKRLEKYIFKAYKYRKTVVLRDR